MTTDPLPSWRDSAAKKSILDFVSAVTDRHTGDFVEELDRVAVFDNDGTLWTEQPMYAQPSPTTGLPNSDTPPTSTRCALAGPLHCST